MALRKDQIQLDVEINGRKADSTFGDLTKKARQLKNELKQLTPGTDAFIKKTAELKKVNSRIAEVREQTKGVTEAQKKAAQVSTLWGRALKAISIVSFFALAERAARGFFSFLFTRTGELDGVNRRFEAVFGESASIVNAWAEQNAISIGVTTNEYRKLAAASGDLLVPIGFQRQEAAALSKEMLDLAAALAIAEGGTKSTAEVSEILNKAILGEREQLKTLGVVISEADVKYRLAQKGQEKFTGEALKQAKAIATLELITDNSTDAIAQFSKSQDSQALTSARISAKLREQADTLATKLIPVLNVFLAFVERAVDTGIRFIDVLAATPRFIKENRASLLALVVALVSFNSASIASTASTLGAVAAQKLAVIWNKRAAFSFKALNVVMKANPIGFIIGLVATLVSGFIALYNRSERVRATIAGLGAVASEAFNIVKKSISLFLDGIKQLKNGDFSAAATSFRDALRNSNPFGEGQRLATAFNKGFKNKLEQESADAAIVPVEVKPFVGDSPVITSSDIVENIKIDDTNGGDTNTTTKSANLNTKTVDRKDDPISILEALALASKKAVEKRLEILREAGELELTEIRKQFLQRMFTEEEFDRLTLEQKARNTQRELDVLESLGLQGTQAYRDAELTKLEIAKEISDQRIEVAEREAEVQRRLQEGGKQAINDFVDVAIDALGRDEVARKKNATAIKAFQKAKVVTNLFSEISGYFNTYSTVPGGQIIAGILSGIAGARAGLAISSINKQKFRKGGGVKFGQFSGPSHESGGVQGVFSDGTRVEVEGNEKFFIVNKKNSPLISFLNGINTLNGNGVPLMRNGGALDFQLSTANTTPNVPLPQQSPSTSIDTSGISEMFGQFLGAFQKIVANAPPAKVVYEHLVEVNNEVNELENKTAL